MFKAEDFLSFIRESRRVDVGWGLEALIPFFGLSAEERVTQIWESSITIATGCRRPSEANLYWPESGT